MSELENLSDSDWLEIASRADDDNDSISSHGELGSRPLSRRSSVSFGSSYESSEIEAWEGFVDESGDELAAEPGMSLQQPLTAHPTEPPHPTGHDLTHDSSDDQQVKAALDQSMIGTLSASRASTASHNSIRDLRLSFPDPLTSSRDQLTKPPVDLPRLSSTTSLSEDGSTLSLNDSIDSSSEEDPELPVITTQVQHHQTHVVPKQAANVTNTGLDIILYGSSSPIKWTFVQDFIQKAANSSGNVVLSSLDPDAGPIQTLDLRCGKDNSILASITVHDCTNENISIADVFDFQDDVIRASLAIVYLPSATLPVLSLHTAYLPVLVPDTSDSTEETADRVLRHVAEDDWELLAVPTSRTITLNTDKSPIFRADALPHLESWRVFEVIRTTLDSPIRPAIKSGSDNSHPVHAVTFFALVSIIMGFAFNTAFRIPLPIGSGSGKNASNGVCGIFSPSQVNRTLAIPVTSATTAVIPSSPKDLSLTVFSPGITSLSVTPPVNSLSVPSRITSLSVNTHGSSLSVIRTASTSLAVPGPSRLPFVGLDEAQVSSSKDVIQRSASELLATANLEPSPNPGGLRFVDGLSEVLDATSQAFDSVVNVENSVKDLLDAIDELVSTIHTQTQIVVGQSKDKARAFKERVAFRNDRARGRAKELKKMGEELLNSASSQFFERTKLAKARAKELKNGLMLSETWKSYEKAHAEWILKLKRMEQCKKDKPGWGRGDVRDSWGTCRHVGVKRVDRPLRAI